MFPDSCVTYVPDRTEQSSSYGESREEPTWT